MEECVFRAIPLALGALIGARYGRRTLGHRASPFVLQALVFGGAHANYPGFPAYSRLVELLAAVDRLGADLPALRPAADDPAARDVRSRAVLDSAVPGRCAGRARAAGAGDRGGARAARRRAVAARAQAGAWRELPESLRNGAWRPGAQAGDRARARMPLAARTHVARVPARAAGARLAGLVAWALFTPFAADVPPLRARPRRRDRGGRRRAGGAGRRRSDRNGGASRRSSSRATMRSSGRGTSSCGARRAPRRIGAGRHGARAAALGGALRDVRRRRRRARRGVARHDQPATSDARDDATRCPRRAPGARLTREAALALAERALETRFGVDPRRSMQVARRRAAASGAHRLVVRVRRSAHRRRPGGEARYVVTVAGDAVSGAGRFVHVPETWTRAERERDNRLQVVGLAAVVCSSRPGSRRSSSASSAGSSIASTRGCCASCSPRRSSLAVLSSINGWPAVAMRLSTTEPLAIAADDQDPRRARRRALRRVARRTVRRRGRVRRADDAATRAHRALARRGRCHRRRRIRRRVAGALGALATPDVPRWPGSAWESRGVAARRRPPVRTRLHRFREPGAFRRVRRSRA